MDRDTRMVATTGVLGAGAVGHALLTWPIDAVVVLFGLGALLAFVGEAIVINRGWLVHHIGPRLLGVPVYALIGWVATIYVGIRIALVVTTGWPAVALAATLTTGYDLLTDHYGVQAGFWTYTDTSPGPRYRGVPWWNYAGWFGLTAVMAVITIQVL